MKNLLFSIVLIACISCKNSNANKFLYTNNLIDETSPYLLQHAHNPVNWNAWNETTLAEAKSNNKLLLISIGYASCHWCHVMEEESFKDSLVAKLMNTNFVNIKIDREERPDIDKVYMSAVQLINGEGGWPLNVIALPDGRPIWGGTYFEKKQWKEVLQKLSEVYRNNPERLILYADNLEKGIKSVNAVQLNSEEPFFTHDFIKNAIKKWSSDFDYSYGGLKRVPKFMMPNNYQFLMRYAYQINDEKLQDFVNLTLTKMAYGGVYDPIEGGFSRYSTDKKWHIPHFEKMLYDNAQMISLYSEAFLITKNKLYKEVALQILDYIKNNMTSKEGLFFSSLDADSYTNKNELEEGAFYVWTKKELKSLLNNDYTLFAKYYNINNYGAWEKENYVLIRNKSDSLFIEHNQLNKEEFEAKKATWKNTLANTRKKRSKPRLDDKVLTSWNSLMIKAYIDAYRVFGDKNYIEAAIKNANFILNRILKEDGSLTHSYKDGITKVNGHLDDYAMTIEAFINLYEITLDQKWLNTANTFSEYTIDYFFDSNSKMFFFTSNKDASLVTRSTEYIDNVMPSSNSIMAKNLFKLSHYFDKKKYNEIATTMLNNTKPEIENYPSSFSNWLDLMMNFTNPYYEVAIVGQDALKKIKELNSVYIPNKLIAGSFKDNKLPLLENRYNPSKTLIYVCVNKACKLPVTNVKDAIKFIK